MEQVGYLEYDPGWNSYSISTSATDMQKDMAAMFVPTDETMKNFFYNGGGRFLIEKYKTIENIPVDVLDDLIRNMMKPSFLSALPSRFAEVMNDAKEPMGVSKSDVVKTYIAGNGVIYVTKKVYGPASYVAVTAPVLTNDNTKIFNLSVKNLQFDAYLLSMDSYYSFIVPLDIPNTADIFGNGLYYVDPVSYAKTQPLIFKFRIKAPNTILATAYKYNIETKEIGDSVRLASSLEIADRLEDMLDYHIVVGDIEDGKQYYRTKGGGEIKVNSSGTKKIWGGGNIELNRTAEVQKIYDQTKATNGSGNGKTYLVDAPLMPPYRSVYKILSEEPQFSEFFNLLKGNDEATQEDAEKYAIFYKDKTNVGMDFNVKSFNTYHYSVYVPTNEAVQRAISKGLPTWDIIKQETDQTVKDSLSQLLVNFLKYHFQDNSIYIDGSAGGKISYETAAYTLTGKKAYYKLETQLSNDGLTLHTNANTTVNVLKNNGLYNIMSRDYKFNNSDVQKASLIETSSWAVIHQIDDVLLYDKKIISKMRQLTKRANTKSKTVSTHRK
ncbi:MAG: fasciclin domain-containing protein [Paludibacteraceae bacterium]